jgi:hypothetical protein
LNEAAGEGVAARNPGGQRRCHQEKAECGQAGQAQSQAKSGKVHDGASLAWRPQDGCLVEGIFN